MAGNSGKNSKSTAGSLSRQQAGPALLPLGKHTGKPPIPLNRPAIIIGSRTNSRIHLQSSTVSQTHALLVRVGNNYYIRDLASRTHVVLDEDRVRERDLRDGQLLQIGSFAFKYIAGPETVDHAPPADPAVLELSDGQPSVFLEERVLLIGRRAGSDVLFTDDRVSTSHAVIFEAEGVRHVRDLGSRTGTFVNGVQVHQHQLNPGDRIRIGGTELNYKLNDALGGLDLSVGSAGSGLNEGLLQKDLLQQELLPGSLISGNVESSGSPEDDFGLTLVPLHEAPPATKAVPDAPFTPAAAQAGETEHEAENETESWGLSVSQPSGQAPEAAPEPAIEDAPVQHFATSHLPPEAPAEPELDADLLPLEPALDSDQIIPGRRGWRSPPEEIPEVPALPIEPAPLELTDAIPFDELGSEDLVPLEDHAATDSVSATPETSPEHAAPEHAAPDTSFTFNAPPAAEDTTLTSEVAEVDQDTLAAQSHGLESYGVESHGLESAGTSSLDLDPFDAMVAETLGEAADETAPQELSEEPLIDLSTAEDDAGQLGNLSNLLLAPEGESADTTDDFSVVNEPASTDFLDLSTDQAEADRREAERADAERVEAERRAAEQAEAQRVDAEHAEAQRVEAERVAAEQAEAQRIEAQLIEAEREAAERAEAQRVEAQRVEAERIEAERVAAEKAAEQVEAEWAESQRVLEAQAAEEKAAADRLAMEQLAETLGSTEPTPESAFELNTADLGPNELGSNELGSNELGPDDLGPGDLVLDDLPPLSDALPDAEPVVVESLSDSSFGKAVDEFTGNQTGDLIEPVAEAADEPAGELADELANELADEPVAEIGFALTDAPMELAVETGRPVAEGVEPSLEIPDPLSHEFVPETVESPTDALEPVVETIESPTEPLEPIVETIESPTEAIELIGETIESAAGSFEPMAETVESSTQFLEPIAATVESSSETYTESLAALDDGTEPIEPIAGEFIPIVDTDEQFVEEESGLAFDDGSRTSSPITPAAAPATPSAVDLSHAFEPVTTGESALEGLAFDDDWEPLPVPETHTQTHPQTQPDAHTQTHSTAASLSPLPSGDAPAGEAPSGEAPSGEAPFGDAPYFTSTVSEPPAAVGPPTITRPQAPSMSMAPVVAPPLPVTECSVGGSFDSLMPSWGGNQENVLGGQPIELLDQPTGPVDAPIAPPPAPAPSPAENADEHIKQVANVIDDILTGKAVPLRPQSGAAHRPTVSPFAPDLRADPRTPAVPVPPKSRRPLQTRGLAAMEQDAKEKEKNRPRRIDESIPAFGTELPGDEAGRRKKDKLDPLVSLAKPPVHETDVFSHTSPGMNEENGESAVEDPLNPVGRRAALTPMDMVTDEANGGRLSRRARGNRQPLNGEGASATGPAVGRINLPNDPFWSGGSTLGVDSSGLDVPPLKPALDDFPARGRHPVRPQLGEQPAASKKRRSIPEGRSRGPIITMAEAIDPAELQRQRRRKLRMIPVILVVAVALMGGLWAAIMNIPLLAPKSVAEASIRFSNFQALNELGRRSFQINERKILQNENTRLGAIRQLMQVSNTATPGFLEDKPEYTRVVDAAAWPDDKKDVLLISHTGSDAEMEKARMRALALSMYDANNTLRDEAATNRRHLEEAQSLIESSRKRSAELKSRIENLRTIGESRPAPQAMATLEADTARLEKAWNESVRALKSAQADLEQLKLAAPGASSANNGPTASAGSDDQLAQLQQQLTAVNAQLAAAKAARSKEAVQARAALDATLAQFAQEVSSAKSLTKDNPELSAYVGAAQKLQETTRTLVDDLIRRQQQQYGRLTDLQSRLSEKMDARRQEMWQKDDKLKDLTDQLAYAQRQLNTAIGTGQRKEAAEFKAQVTLLESTIKSRQEMLPADSFYTDAIDELQKIIDQQKQSMQEDRQKTDELLAQLQKSFAESQPSVDKLPTEQKTLASSMEKRLADINAARQKYSQLATAASDASDADGRKLTEQAAALATSIDSRRKTIADQTLANQKGQVEQKRLADIQSKQAEVESLTAATTAAEQSYVAKTKELQTMRNTLEQAKSVDEEMNKSIDEQTRIDRDMEQNIRDMTMRQDAVKDSVEPVAVADNDIVVNAGKDNRLLYVISEIGVIMAITLALVILTVHQAAREIPINALEPSTASREPFSISSPIEVEHANEHANGHGNGNGNGNGNGVDEAAAPVV